MDFLLDPFQFDFMIRSLSAALIVAIVCSILGTYIVLRGMAFFADALAHTTLPGVVIAYLIGWPVAVGALIFGILTALGIGWLTDKGQLKEDTAIGVIFAGFFALGVALLSTTGNYSVDLAHFLFGNLLAVSSSDLWLIAILAAIVLLTIYLFYKEFLLISFDEILGITLRLPIRFLRLLLLVLIAITIVTALNVVGIALILSMFVTPAATASLLTKRLPSMMAISALIGTISAIVGLYASYYLDIASGAAIVLVTSIIFLLVFLFAPSQGFVWRTFRTKLVK